MLVPQQAPWREGQDSTPGLSQLRCYFTASATKVCLQETPTRRASDSDCDTRGLEERGGFLGLIRLKWSSTAQT
jgi:hypothetical protein